MPATVEAAQTTRVARAGDSISLLSLMPNILQEAVAMAETLRARRERSSFARATTLKRSCATLASMAGTALLVFTHARCSPGCARRIRNQRCSDRHGRRQDDCEGHRCLSQG